MQTLFYIKTANAKPTAKNSVVLRFTLAETGKPLVRGLGISCTLQDWDKKTQRILKSHEDHERFNAKLEFITKELKDIEKVTDVKAEDIDKIVEASIKGVTLQELEDKSSLLTEMLENQYQDRKDSPAFSSHSKRKLISVKNSLEKFEAKMKYQISADSLNKSTLSIQNDLVKYFRGLGNKDSSIKDYLGTYNAAINYHCKLTGNTIKTFSKRDSKWDRSKKQIIALNTEELKRLYEFVFNPEPDKIKTTPAELRNMKYFLFRCFCGMRIGDMNAKNINKKSLKKDAKTFKYFQDKGVKSATVFCIGSYLYDIADSLGWDFPNFTTNSALFSYSTNETEAVRKHLRHLYKDDSRQIEHISESGYHFTNLSDEVTTHTSRKTFAHLLYSITKDVMLVKKQLGHTKIETTMKYLDFDISGDSMDLKHVNLGF
ncbi:tyrosine-type recombinase/integrase [Algoriphagus aquimarinus]|uniref:tyrosine-type recombinase/integrase n=1 Tax=Algoriphagus aquimarinus TaxID=237018 RepID=UPI0030DDAB4E|tara:strand:- start:56852 stop:58141 length:1290 start_codon:yes stop_codon:yes gene_type:complete